MIEVVIDFNKVELKDYGDAGYVPSNIKEAVINYVSHKLNIPEVGNWDAFRDNIWILRYKEWIEYREKDEWESYEEYLEEKELNSQYGVKNEQGLRDDLKLIFVNFQPFFLKYRSVACQLLEILFGVIEETKKYSTDDGDDILKMDIYIKS
jgi:hypothetical protein